jgi:hypothetical protein
VELLHGGWVDVAEGVFVDSGFLYHQSIRGSSS